MTDQISTKRSYTVPVLLVIIVLLVTLLVIIYTRLLVSQQAYLSDQGKKLSEQYVHAVVFAQNLHDGSNEMLNATNETERIRAAKMLGMATLASGESLGLFVEAAHLASDQPKEEVSGPLTEAVNALVGVNGMLASIGEHGGPLTEEEKADLVAVRDGAAQMQQTLLGFVWPTTDSGFRQMVTLKKWTLYVLEASEILKQIVD